MVTTKSVLFPGHKREFVEVREKVEEVDPTVHCRPHLRGEEVRGKKDNQDGRNYKI